MSSSTPPPQPRRFKPEPVETSSKSSRRLPEPVEITSRTVRRFAPEPVEVSAKSVRRFAPQPVETTTRNNHADSKAESTPVKRSRFAPIPVETTTRSRRKNTNDTSEKAEPRVDSTQQPTISVKEAEPPSVKPQPRKFAPQLIETAKRTRKAGDVQPAVLPSDRTEATPERMLARFRQNRPHPLPVPPDNTPIISADNLHDILEARRLGVPISTRQSSMSSTRSHSFRVPDLEPIDSSESGGSNPPSVPSSPSASSEQSYMYKHATRIRESVDDRYSGYLLKVAAQAAEKQLREQALAAFPNDDQHQPVDHFIDREMDDNNSGSGGRKSNSSFVQINWELREMQAHQERLSQKRESQRKLEESLSAKSDEGAGPWKNPAAGLFSGLPRDGELERMRTGARPPMLGDDIKFPRCRSPDPARFDVTQGSEALRDSMCYLTQQTKEQEDHEGLWEQKKDSSPKPSLWLNATSRPPSRGGLWGGCCVGGTGHTPPRGRSGLMTPRVEIENPFDTPSPSPQPGLAPFLLAPSTADFTSIDEKLQTEVTIEEEFNDAFVTQVYNYLSIGYPSIARDYDEELSKISRIPISELRQDDHLAENRGYIRLGEDDMYGVSEDSCMRWRALRLYIHEWARQQPGMVSAEHALGGYGVGAAARKGSWAI